MSVDRAVLRRESWRQIYSSPLLFFEIFVRLIMLVFAMRIFSLRGLIDRLKFRSGRVPQSQLKLIQRFSGIWERHFFRRQSCLTSSLLLFWMAPRGSRLYVGVLRQDSSIEAHAWLESEGKIFSGTEDHQKYQVLWSEAKQC